jgi:pimeloyl-ACP methyl ester carboxylesterase
MYLYVQETGDHRFSTIVFLHGMITGGWMWQQQIDPELVGQVILSGTNILPLPPRMRFTNLIFLPFMKTGRFMRLASASLRLSSEAAALYSESLRRMPYRTLWRISQQSANYRVPANVKFSEIPALIVAGQMEHTLIIQSIRRLLAILPDSRGYLAPSGRHGWVGEAPDVFAQMVRAWFGHGQMPPELLPVGP